MIAFLKNRHGDIQGLNDAWATDYASFDDLLSPIEHLPDTQSAQEDFQEFNAMLIDQYGRAVSQALREAGAASFEPGHALRQRSIREDAERRGDAF